MGSFAARRDGPGEKLVVIQARRGWRSLDLAELLQHGDLFRFLVNRDVKVLYKQSVLGFGWAILAPLTTMVVFTVIFGRLAGIPSDGVPYSLFAFTALVPWTYFSNAVQASSNSLVSQANVFTKAYFPRMLIPLTPIFAKLVDFGIALAVLAILMAVFRRVPGAGLAVIPILVLLMVLTASGVGLWLSALSVQYRDVKFAMGFLTQLLMYAAPVVWPVSLVPEAWRPVYALYPMVAVIDGFRSSLLRTGPVPWDLITIGGASSLALVLSGAFYFRRMERHFADVA